MTSEERRKEIRAIQKRHPWFYTLIIVAIALGTGAGMAASEFADDSRGFWMNLTTEALGVVTSVVITVFVIDRIYERRDEMRRTEDLKRRLVREAGSRSTDVALSAIEHIRENDWLTGDDGVLRNARLDYAELQNADLGHANLELAWFWRANLRKVNLFGANLKGANLWEANLQTDLRYANLQEALLLFANLQSSRLTHANLQGADMTNAYMQRADMRAANLQGAYLTHARLEDATLSTRSGDECIDQQFAATLPDGSLHTKDIDLAKFTDPSHPDFQATLEIINEIRNALKFNNRLPPI